LDTLDADSTQYINLLDPTTFENYLVDPSRLRAVVSGLTEKIKTVVIDEIQKVPPLLDVVHLLIEETKRSHKKIRFALTGSSARKLKKGSSNLLAGRASIHHLFPLTSIEIGEEFNLNRALQWGTLPEGWFIQDDIERARFLRSYAQTYLKEEIWDEHIIRNLAPFRKFLEVAAQTTTTIVNYSKIANDVGVDTTTAQSYFQIIEDTLIGILLEPFHESVRKRQRANPKFYLFDTGIQRALTKQVGIELLEGTYDYGRSFEHFLITEILRLSSYKENDYSFSYLRTKDDAEIDLIIDRPGLPRALIEIKSKTRIDESDLVHLRGFLPSFPKAEAFCLSRDTERKKFGRIVALPWNEGLKELGLV
jgi:predicted AAA+ superfamily ATPase